MHASLVDEAWRASVAYHWGYEFNASKDSRHYGKQGGAEDANGTTHGAEDAKMCVVNASNFYRWGPTGGIGDTTKAPFQMYNSSGALTNDISGVRKKSDAELLDTHSCVRGGGDLQCCGNFTHIAEVQYRDDLANAECCGQLVYDSVGDHCCALQGHRTGFDDDTTATGSNPFSFVNRGNIRIFRTTGDPLLRCCGDGFDYMPLDSTMADRTRCCVDDDQEALYTYDPTRTVAQNSVCCQTRTHQWNSPFTWPPIYPSGPWSDATSLV